MDTTHSDSSEAEKQARSFLCWGSRLFFVSCYAADCLISRLGCWTMPAAASEKTAQPLAAAPPALLGVAVSHAPMCTMITPLLTPS